jgi:DNA-binding protein HU-beta
VFNFKRQLDTAWTLRYKPQRLLQDINDTDLKERWREHTMNKGELIDKIAKDAKVSKVQASNALNSAIDGVVSTLKKGSKVTLVGFGTFSVSSRKARTGRNPQTGAPLKIPAKKVTKFVAGAELKKAVNRGR